VAQPGRRLATYAAAAFGLLAGCCPPLDPVYPPLPPGTPRAADACMTSPSPRTIPAPVVGRFQQPSTPVRAKAEAPVKREMIKEPPVGLPGPKLDEIPVQREPHAPPKPPSPEERLPDEVVMRLLESGRAVFVRCFKKAFAADPLEPSFKVRLRVELDAAGAITSATTDAANKTLDACLTRSAGWVKFPASGRRIVVDLPLFYRAE
jgi:hypothetical protein